MEANKPRGDRMSESRSFGSNCQRLSQSRKISIGVLVDSIANSQTKGVKEAVIQTAEDGTSSKRNCVNNNKGQTPVLEKQVTVPPENASPWVSARSFNIKKSSSVAVHDAEQTPSFTRKTQPRPKLSKTASLVHSVKFFGGKKSDLESDEGRQDNFGKATDGVEDGFMNNVEQVENHIFSTERQVLPEKELAVDKNRKAETGGSETLRTKLWEILGNVSSPIQPCPSPEPAELHPNQEMDREHGAAEKTNPNSDTIESDSERPDHATRKPLTRSMTQKKASTKEKHKKVEVTNSTCHRKEQPQKSTFSLRGDWPKKSYDTVNDGSLLYKRNKIKRDTSGVEKHQDQRNENTEERQRLKNKSKSTSAVEKSMFQRNKAENSNKSNNVTSNVIAEQKSGTTKTNSFDFPVNFSTEKRKDVETPELKDQQKDISNSLLKNKGARNNAFVEQKSGTAKKNSFEYPLNFSGEKHRDFGSPKSKDRHEDIANSLLKNKRVRNNIFAEQKSGTAKKSSCNYPLNFSIEQQRDVEIPELKDQQEDVANSLLKNKRARSNVFIEQKSGTAKMDSFDHPLNFSSEQQRDVETPELKEQQEDIANSLLKTKRARSNVFIEQKSGTAKKNSFDHPLNFSGEQQSDVEIPELKDQQEDIVNPLLKKKRVYVQDSSSPSFEIKSPVESSPACLQKSKKEKLHEQSPAENLINTKGIRSFKNLLNLTPAECKSNVKGNSSFIMEECTENRLSKSPSDTSDSESSEDDSYIKGCRESEKPSPELCFAELRGPDKRPCNMKSAGMTGLSPFSESLTGSEESGEHQMYSQKCHEDGLASIVALLTTTLNRVKTKMKSVTSKKSAEILRAAAEKIFLQLENAESEIRTDVGKLTNLSKSKRKRLETRFQEKQEQLLGIYKKFREEVNQHLDYGSIFEDIEEHEIELKETVERQSSSHKKLLAQTEQAIKEQLDDTESRVLAVHNSAKEKMLQLKLVVAECIKQGMLD